MININSHFELQVKTEFENQEQKLDADIQLNVIARLTAASKISGIFTSTTVDLIIESKKGNHGWTRFLIKGEQEKSRGRVVDFIAKVYINDLYTTSFNFHPVTATGGLDMECFMRTLTTIFK